MVKKRSHVEGEEFDTQVHEIICAELVDRVTPIRSNPGCYYYENRKCILNRHVPDGLISEIRRSIFNSINVNWDKEALELRVQNLLCNFLAKDHYEAVLEKVGPRLLKKENTLKYYAMKVANLEAEIPLLRTVLESAKQAVVDSEPKHLDLRKRKN